MYKSIYNYFIFLLQFLSYVNNFTMIISFLWLFVYYLIIIILFKWKQRWQYIFLLFKEKLEDQGRIQK